MRNDRKKTINGKKQQNLMPAIYTLLLIAAGIAVMFSGSIFMRGGRMMPMDDTYFETRLVLSALNIVLIVYLLFTYIKDYMATKANFTIGIIAFLFVFLLNGLSSFPFTLLLFDYPPRGMVGPGIFSFVPILFTTIALIIFLKISET